MNIKMPHPKSAATKTIVPLTVTTDGDRMSVGSSIKITRKFSGSDSFVGVEASCTFSTTVPNGQREKVKADASAFVRSTVMGELSKSIDAIRKEMGE